MPRATFAALAALSALSCALLMPLPVGAQNPRGGDQQSGPRLSDFDATTAEGQGRIAQFKFEQLRRNNLPQAPRGKPGKCDEQVGRFCYWYDERPGQLAAEPAITREARTALIAKLDTLNEREPTNRWLSAQRIRYLTESQRLPEALAVAKNCQVGGWWCSAITGFSYHVMGQYAAADSAYKVALSGMSQRDRCKWRDLTLYIDDDLRQQYRRSNCGDGRHEAFEDRVWFFSRVLYGQPGNDSRTEHFARLTYTLFLQDAPTTHQFGFDDDERELLQRFGWPVNWAKEGNGRDGPSILSAEATPAYRLIPPSFVLDNPTVSDSTDWAVQLPPVIARYAPPYAATLVKLRHQEALFRRGDSALVVLAYSVDGLPAFAKGPRRVALSLSPNDPPRNFSASQNNAPLRGVLTARAPWDQLIMSAEVTAPNEKAVARARYGIRPPNAVGARVGLSDLLFFKSYGGFPSSIEEVLPHANDSEQVKASEKLGVYWEAYGTNPVGEKVKITLTVAREIGERGLLARGMQALNLEREATPVRVSVEELTARNSSTSPRGLELDISTLKPGNYIVQLEIDVRGQYVIRAERRIEVVPL